jgi:2-(1,2-epoxy-1,2-dihydrophenyl)acetyl-CoA isomerase
MTNSSEKSDQAPLLVRDEGRLRILTLNRADRMNALTPELHHQLRDALSVAATDSNIGAVILTGAGKAFCSGGDVTRSQESADQAKSQETVEERVDLVQAHARSTLLLNRMAKPTIALIKGVAAGSGLTLALACDLRFAQRGAVLRTAYLRIALPGDLGISYFLSRLVGPARARELMFLNEKIDADAAERMGLVNRVFDETSFDSEAFAIARALAEGPGVALRYMKQTLALAETSPLELVIEREAHNTARCVRTQDVKEASAAFREKRAPRFKSL